MYVINVTGFGKNGVIAGSVKLIFFLLSLKVSLYIAMVKHYDSK